MAIFEALKGVVNVVTNPPFFITLASIVFFLTVPRPAVWRPRVALVIALAAAAFLAVSMLDPNFAKIVKKPDNIPIVAMLFLVGFFLWVSLWQAHNNDARIAQGLPPAEGSDGEELKTWVWPDLVYTELLCMVIGMIILVVWGIAFQAPIEEPANPARTPNPSKAPWYFLGLQEMLVYYDPWLAGVVFPSLIIVGLMAIPYMDTNPKGNGYFTFKERRTEILLFLFGFLILWVLLVLLGTFLRGPNWNFFGPYEYWDLHKLLVLNNINLSEYFWVRWTGWGLPRNMWLRELPGFLIVISYLVVLPGILARTWLKRFHQQMGPWRFAVFLMLFIGMIALPLKMVSRWLFNLKYVVAMPEIFFNI
jgi:hypothetical protein